MRIKHKKRARIKIQPRFKIQYPMKNRGKDIRKDSHPQDVKINYPGIFNYFLQAVQKLRYLSPYRSPSKYNYLFVKKTH